MKIDQFRIDLNRFNNKFTKNSVQMDHKYMQTRLFCSI